MKRLFIVDPVCGQVLGHNFTMLTELHNCFSDLNLYDKIICVANNCLNEIESCLVEVDPLFHFYYFDKMQLHDNKGNPISAPEDFSEEEQCPIAKNDFALLFEKYDINSNDTIYFPGVDFYGLLGISSFFEESSLSGVPRLFIRFIGVMENATNIYHHPLREIKRSLNKLMARCSKVILSAESIRYAQYLSLFLETDVYAIPIPLLNKYTPIKQDTPFTVAMPGSGRIDKGFIVASEIIRCLAKNYSAKNFLFKIQMVTENCYAQCMDSLKVFYALPCVELLPSSISRDEMNSMLIDSHVMLMPYDSNVYKYRSSAIFTEAVSVGRQLVTSSGTGFEQEVSYYGAGKICSCIEQYADAIVAYAEMKPSDLSSIALRARNQYDLVATSIYKGFFK